MFASIKIVRDNTSSTMTIEEPIIDGKIQVSMGFANLFRQGWRIVESNPPSLIDDKPCPVDVFFHKNGEIQGIKGHFDGKQVHYNADMHKKLTKEGWKFKGTDPISYAFPKQ